jgi:YD repeat-containing protein
MQYDYETGAPVRTQDSQGVVQTFTYDGARRLSATTDEKTGATMRRIYDENGTLTATFRKMGANFNELGTYTVLDGVGRIRAKAMDPISKAGGYRGIYVNRDARGRVINQTKPTKMSSSWIVAEPVALNSVGSSGRETASQSIVGSIVAGFTEFMNVVEPTTHAQSGCVPGYYCGDTPPDVEWGMMDYNGMPASVDIDGATYSVTVSYEPESVTVSLIHDGGVQTDWGAQFAIGGLLEAMMGAFGEVAGVFAETTGGEVSGEVADTAGNVVADQNTLNHIFGNPEHGFDAFLSQFGGNWQTAFQAIRGVVQSVGLPEGYFETIVNVNGTNVWVQGRVISGVVDINTASAVIH